MCEEIFEFLREYILCPDLEGSHRFVEVMCFSTCKLKNGCCGRCLCYIMYLTITAIFIIFPLSFGLAAKGMEQFEVIDISSSGEITWEKVVYDEPIFFTIMGSDEVERDSNEDGGIPFLLWSAVIWGIFNIFVQTIIVYRKTKNYKDGGTCKSIGISASVSVLRIFFSIMQIVGLMNSASNSNLSVFVVFIVFWPIADFLRLLDVLESIIFRSNIKCLSMCFQKDYVCSSMVLDILGGGAGFQIMGDPFWEKLGQFVVETLDFIFSIVFIVQKSAHSIQPNLLNIFSILKIISITINIILSLKSFIWIYNYLISLVVSSIFGAFFFATFFLMFLRSVILTWTLSYVVFIVPLIVIIALFSLFVVLCAQTSVDAKDSVFTSDISSDGGWNGDCTCLGEAQPREGSSKMPPCCIIIRKSKDTSPPTPADPTASTAAPGV